MWYVIWQREHSPYLQFALFDNWINWLQYMEKNQITEKHRLLYRGEADDNTEICTDPKSKDGFTMKPWWKAIVIVTMIKWSFKTNLMRKNQNWIRYLKT